MLRETVEIVKAMWTEPDVTYEGTHFTLDGAQCDPKPVQQPHPPIWIGGGGEQLTLRVVARHADASNFGGKPARVGRTRARCCKGHCDDVGRDYDEIRKTWSPEMFIRETEAGDRRRRHRARSGASRSNRGATGNLVGTPEQVAEKIQSLRRPRLHRASSRGAATTPTPRRSACSRRWPGASAEGLVRFVELGEALRSRLEQRRVQVG